MSEGGPPKSNADILQDLIKYSTWEDFFFKTPCVRSSYLWGLGCGSIMMAHKLRLYRGNVRTAVNSGVLTFILVSGISFGLCVRETNAKYEMIRNAFRNNGQFKEDKKA